VEFTGALSMRYRCFDVSFIVVRLEHTYACIQLYWIILVDFDLCLAPVLLF